MHRQCSLNFSLHGWGRVAGAALDRGEDLFGVLRVRDRSFQVAFEYLII